MSDFSVPAMAFYQKNAGFDEVGTSVPDIGWHSVFARRARKNLPPDSSCNRPLPRTSSSVA